MPKRNGGGEIKPRITTHSTTNLSPGQALAAKQGESPAIRDGYDAMVAAGQTGTPR